MKLIRQPRRWLLVIGFALSLSSGVLGEAGIATGWPLMALWLAAMVSFVIFAAGLLYPYPVYVADKAAWRAMLPSLQVDQWEWLLVGVLFALSLTTRVAWLDRLPDLMVDDEAGIAARALRIATTQHWQERFYSYDPTGQPVLFHMLQAISIALQGPTVNAARLPSAILGALAIPGLYMAARIMFNPRVATVAAVALACLPLHLHLSRSALNSVWDSTCLLWALAFLFAGLRNDKQSYWGNFVVAGILLGVSQYGYAPSRVIPLIMVGFGVFLTMTRSAILNVHRRALIGMIGIAVIVVLPQLYYVVVQQQPLSLRAQAITVWASPNSAWNIAGHSDNLIGFWLTQVAKSFLSYVAVPDAGLFFGNFRPMLEWVAASLFIIGLAVSFKTRREPAFSFILIWWILGTVFGSVLLTNPPEYQRLVIVTPALAMFVGIGADLFRNLVVGLAKRIWPAAPNLPSRVSLVTFGIVIAVLALTSLKEYFVDYRAAHVYFAKTPTQTVNEIADQVLPALRDYKIWYPYSPATDLSESSILAYKQPDIHGMRFIGSVDELMQSLTAYHGKQSIIVLPDYPHLIELLDKMKRLPGFQLLPPLRDLTEGFPSALVFVSEGS